MGTSVRGEASEKLAWSQAEISRLRSEVEEWRDWCDRLHNLIVSLYRLDSTRPEGK